MPRIKSNKIIPTKHTNYRRKILKNYFMVRCNVPNKIFICKNLPFIKTKGEK